MENKIASLNPLWYMLFFLSHINGPREIAKKFPTQEKETRDEKLMLASLCCFMFMF